MTRYDLVSEDGSFSVDLTPAEDGFEAVVSEDRFRVRLKKGARGNVYLAELSDKPFAVTLIQASPEKVELVIGGESFSYRRPAAEVAQPATGPLLVSPEAGVVRSPMPGKVISAFVKEGEKVKAGDPLVILESMKMEVAVRSDRDGEVSELLVKEGATVKRGQALVRLL